MRIHELRRAMQTACGEYDGARVHALRANGAPIGQDQKRELLERSVAGEHVELEIDIVAYAQTPGVTNRNFVRFRPGRLQSIAKSGTGTVFLRDHDHGHVMSAGGTIVSSRMVKDGETRQILQTARLTVPWAVQAALQGVTTKFSIGWSSEAAPHCTVCKAPYTQCIWDKGHFRGTEHDGAIVEYEYQDATLVETSAVNVPAVPETGVRGVRQVASATGYERIPTICTPFMVADAILAATQGESQMSTTGQDLALAQLRAVLGLSSATTSDEIMAKVEALRDEARDAKAAAQEQIGKVTALQAELAARDEAIIKLQIEAKQAATNAILHELRTEGRLGEGTAFDAMAKGYHDRGDLDGLKQLAAGLREQAPAVPVGKRQSVDENRPSTGELQLPPRTASNDVDYDAIAAKLPSATRERFAELAAKSSWKMIMTTPDGARLMAQAGYHGGAR